MNRRFLGSLAVVLLLATHATAQVYEFTIDPADSNFVMMGNVFQQEFDCAGNEIDPDPVPVGPIRECPSGDPEIPVTVSGTLKMILRRDAVSGTYVARFIGGNLETPTFSGFVGSCSSPDAELQICTPPPLPMTGCAFGLRFNLSSAFFPVQLAGIPAGCVATDNIGAPVSMHVLEGSSMLTSAFGTDTISLDCKSSTPTPMCGLLGRRTLEVRFGSASPLVFPFTYSADFCPLFGRLDFTGTLRFSGTLRGRMTRILAGHATDPTPNCP